MLLSDDDKDDKDVITLTSLVFEKTFSTWAMITKTERYDNKDHQLN